MAFPGSIPSYAGFVAGDTLQADNHASQHNSEQADIAALATKMGTGSSTPVANRVLRGLGAGTSAWAQVDLTGDVTGVLAQANGGTGTTLATGTGKAVYDTSPTISGASLTGSPTLTTPTIADHTNAAHTHANAAQGGQIVSGAIPADAVNDSQMIYGKLRTRQGGSATDWSSAGTTTYDYSGTNIFTQCGTKSITADGTIITFPTAFNQVPVLVATQFGVVSASGFVRINSITATTASITLIDASGAVVTTEKIFWIAIGE